jgi:hypothetical protein
MKTNIIKGIWGEEQDNNQALVFETKGRERGSLVFNSNGFEIEGITITDGVITCTSISGSTGSISKYSTTISLSAGTPYPVTTTATTEPYSIMVLDSTGVEITASIEILVELSGGFYVVTLESTEAIANIKLKILY